MKVAVLGAGAIGAFVGTALARGGADVHLIARGAHLKAMRTRGVRVCSPRGDFHVHLPATSNASDVGPVDFVFLALKAHSYSIAGPWIKPLTGPNTVVIAAQNGIPWWYFYRLTGPYEGRRVETVDPGGRVTAIIPYERAIGCVVYCSITVEAPGVIRHFEGTRFSIGEPDGSTSERCARFSAAMVAGGLECPVTPNIRDDIWIKLMGNAAFNPLSALTRASMAEMCHHPPTRRLIEAIMSETLEVAHRLGSTPDISIEHRMAIAERFGEHKLSMLQDLERGKTLELDAIIGAVVELADLTGVAAPSLRAVYASSDLLARTLGLARLPPSDLPSLKAKGIKA